MPEAAIQLLNVSKRFPRVRVYPSLKSTLVGALRGQRVSREAFWALHEVSLEIPKGQSLGLIGPNGCGKTTTLSLISRILRPTSGQVRTQGRICTLLHLGAGFHPDLTGRENLYLNAAILGIAQKLVRQRFDMIVDFAELAEAIDQPLRTYSNGMMLRLGFAIAIHVDPDILLVDEVLAVGDEHFQHKCHARVGEYHAAGGTLILVSHDLELVRRTCAQTVWLQAGRIAAQGPTEEVVAQYRRAEAAG